MVIACRRSEDSETSLNILRLVSLSSERRHWGSPRGLRSFANGWTLAHLVFGALIGLCATTPFRVVAGAPVIAMAVMSASTVAWSKVAATALRDTRVDHAGLRWIVFAYQMAFLVTVACGAAWSMVGLGCFAHPPLDHGPVVCAGRAALAALSAVAVGEHWAVVLRTHQAMIAADRKRADQSTAAGSGP